MTTTPTGSRLDQRRRSLHDLLLRDTTSFPHSDVIQPTSPPPLAYDHAVLSSSMIGGVHSSSSVTTGGYEMTASDDDSLMTTGDAGTGFMSNAPLRLIRQHSFGVDEPPTATIREFEEDEEDELVTVELKLLNQALSSESVTVKSNQRQSGISYRAIQPPQRLFHSFLLLSLTGYFSISELCTSFIPVNRQWRRFGHHSLVHPNRRMQKYAAVEGGRSILLELKRLVSNREIKRRIESVSSSVQASLYARHRVDQFTLMRLASSSATCSPATSPTAALISKSSGPIATPPTATQLLAPSVTLLQHVQFLPASQTASSTSRTGRPLLARLKHMFRQYAAANAHILTDSDCLLISTHLVHLRVLRIYDGSKITNEGIKCFSMQLKHLRILHIGHLSDRNVDDQALGYISDGLKELHSLWLTQDTNIPIPTMWHPNPRVLYNLFSASGVVRLCELHQSLHHLNLGGFRNITSTGLRMISTGQPRLHLHSLHLNGWHITDECLAILESAHSSCLYHLHLFDVGISNAGLQLLSRLTHLETLILDHVREVDERGMEMMVEEAIARVQQHELEQLERVNQFSPYHPPPSTDDVPILSLYHLELHSCVHLLSSNAILYLSLHPTLHELEVSGLCTVDQLTTAAYRSSSTRDWRTHPSCQRTLAQVEELSEGRIRCNGGMTTSRIRLKANLVGSSSS